MNIINKFYVKRLLVIVSLVADYSVGVAGIMFSSSHVVGLGIMAALLIEPGTCVLGLACLAAAQCTGRLAGMTSIIHTSPAYVFNPMLCGLALGHVYGFNFETIILAGVCGAMVFVCTTLLFHLGESLVGLPALTIPFSLVAVLGCMAMGSFGLPASGSSVVTFRLLSLPWLLETYLLTLGWILFAPDVAVGIVVCALLLITSQILFLLSVLGFAAGLFVQMVLVGHLEASLAAPGLFNSVLTTMALGGILLIPGGRVFGAATIAAACTAVVTEGITHFLGLVGSPAFTLPFCLVTLSAFYVLRLLGKFPVPTHQGRTPEETLEFYHANLQRFPGPAIAVFPPFAGKWTVWQGVDGEWTHKGPWRWAFDFVVTDSKESTHKGAGTELSDYYAYGKPVLSPIRGTVVHVVEELPDNTPGTVDELSKWGNLVIIQNDEGFFVELSHFACRSIRVTVGERVEPGSLLGLCGASGYSPEPHIHVQVQATAIPGAASIPFGFNCMVQDGTFKSSDVPVKGSLIESVFPDGGMARVMNLLLGETLVFQVRKSGLDHGQVRFRVEMTENGTMALVSERGKMFYSCSGHGFLAIKVEGDDPWLRVIFLALPRLPPAYRLGLTWQDSLPVGLVLTGLHRELARFMTLFSSNWASAQAVYRFEDSLSVVASIEHKPLGVQMDIYTEFDPQGIPGSICFADLELNRVENEVREIEVQEHIAPMSEREIYNPEIVFSGSIGCDVDADVDDGLTLRS